jgi:hypothetical protein
MTSHEQDPPRRDEHSEDDEDVDAKLDEYAEVDLETVADDAIDYFSDEPGAADSPAADADAPPPG